MVDAQKDGGPAFPVPTDMSGEEALYLATPGMSLRDWFAGQADTHAAQSLLHRELCEALTGRPMPSAEDLPALLRWHFDVIAAVRYIAADAMLEARK